MKKSTILILEAVMFLLIFIASLYHSADLDLGWHLRYGEYFVQHHAVLRENIFTSTMAGYKYPNTSWGMDIITYQIFNSFGFLGITFLGALVVTLTFFIFSKTAKLTLWDQIFILPFLLFIMEPVNAASFRAEQVSFLMLGLEMWILSRFNPQKPKLLILMPPIFLFWVNLHGEYLTGLAVFAFWILSYFTKEIFVDKVKLKKIIRHMGWLTAAFAVSCLVTLLNPFGFDIYKESLRHFGNTLEKFVVEWLPLVQFSRTWWDHVALGALVLFGLNIIIKKREFKNQLSSLGIFLIMFPLPFWMIRYAWITYLLSLPLLKPITSLFHPKNPQTSFKIISAVLAVYVIFVFKGKGDFQIFFNMSWETYCKYYSDCSPDAAKYIVDHHLTQKLFTFYDFGGWLEWNYPEIKPSMDGRMALWRDVRGYSAFSDYIAYEHNFWDIDQSEYDVVLMSPRKRIYLRLMQLVSEKKWKLLYSDQFAGVFVRNAAIPKNP